MFCRSVILWIQNMETTVKLYQKSEIYRLFEKTVRGTYKGLFHDVKLTSSASSLPNETWAKLKQFIEPRRLFVYSRRFYF